MMVTHVTDLGLSRVNCQLHCPSHREAGKWHVSQRQRHPWVSSPGQVPQTQAWRVERKHELSPLERSILRGSWVMPDFRSLPKSKYLSRTLKMKGQGAQLLTTTALLREVTCQSGQSDSIKGSHMSQLTLCLCPTC